MCAAGSWDVEPPAERIQTLDVAQCYELLATDTVGRIVYTDGAMPAITPVNYVLDGHHVVFRTAEGSRLARAVSGAVVAFEVDQLDRATRTGWSVVVTGVAREIGEGSDQGRNAALTLAPWAGGRRPLAFSIAPGVVTGRWIGA